MSSIPETPRSPAPARTARPRRTDAPPTALRAVEDHARRRPDAPALSDGRRGLTSGELDRFAAAFAAVLAARGAGPEVPVAIAVADPIARTVACLAAWKSGAAYVPLDPEAPPARLSFIVADCGAPLVVSDGAGRAFAGSAAIVPIALDGLRPAPPVPPPSAADDPRRLAYVIYTSGSTGEPKGVAVEHGSLARLIAWHGRAFEVRPGDRASGFANPAFDAAVWELWGALAHGASVRFPPAGIRSDAERLRDWIVGEEITVAFAPTPVAERLVALPWPEGAPLRWLLTGGDVLRTRPPAGLPFRLVNNYGPTENTVVATSGVVDPGGAGARPSIGRPIDGVEALILDGSRPCADGEAGELCVGGALLARGYAGGAARQPGGFEMHPLRRGARLYRTGDRVRRRTDGELEFLGRLDDQVKIRGFRVEPAEVESALGGHPSVRAAVVLASDEPDGEKRLVAWIVRRTGAEGEDLRAHLRARLPEYMVPSAFVEIPELPLTPHGKVDRGALPPPPRETPGASAGRPPGSPVEERVAAIAAELLRLDRVGVDENFFAIGGHSLLGTQMIARVRGAFGVELPLRAIFEAPTVARLSGEIEKAVLRRVEAMSEEEARRLADGGAP